MRAKWGQCARHVREVKVSKRIGRPPRRDNPQRIQIVLPGKLRAWLRVQAAREARDQGDVVGDGLKLYRENLRARRKR